MPRLNNAMELFKELKRTNCRECGVPTCLAFAAAVLRGDKRLENCPHIDKALLERFNESAPDPTTLEMEQDHSLDPLREKIAEIDFASSLERLGAELTDGKLKIRCLGKDFYVHKDARVTSMMHIHTWVTIPLLYYVVYSEGKEPTGKWVTMRDLKEGAERSPLFERRTVNTLKNIADAHLDLFEDMIQIFNGKRVEGDFGADISVVLHPLPKVPMLFCYWKAEEGIESQAQVFFDATAADNLPIEALYTLCTGLVVMFDKIAHTHTRKAL